MSVRTPGGREDAQPVKSTPRALVAPASGVKSTLRNILLGATLMSGVAACGPDQPQAAPVAVAPVVPVAPQPVVAPQPEKPIVDSTSTLVNDGTSSVDRERRESEERVRVATMRVVDGLIPRLSGFGTREDFETVVRSRVLAGLNGTEKGINVESTIGHETGNGLQRLVSQYERTSSADLRRLGQYDNYMKALEFTNMEDAATRYWHDGDQSSSLNVLRRSMIPVEGRPQAREDFAELFEGLAYYVTDTRGETLARLVHPTEFLGMLRQLSGKISATEKEALLHTLIEQRGRPGEELTELMEDLALVNRHLTAHTAWAALSAEDQNSVLAVCDVARPTTDPTPAQLTALLQRGVRRTNELLTESRTELATIDQAVGIINGFRTIIIPSFPQAE